jgi:hypothetical protein
MRDQSGDIVKWPIKTIDIEDRKRAEVKPRASNAFATSAETAQTALGDRPDHRVTRISDHLTPLASRPHA